ncbi:MAG: bifunctional hydroxymethylpyrimidine kinase/phosphomethylpyrimidine kinase [Tissierellia bacterium]|nr:bifunctional hydroxymethylpyrimidine kinase/phosphomethylpyrimidine kinase [Tissierellia bacterium]
MKRLLTIAGSDCSGGAGIQADLKTFCAHGHYGMSAITALTAQNTMGVKDIFSVTGEFLKSQLDVILDDVPPDGTKVGMVGGVEIISLLGNYLQNRPIKPLVIDPVMVSTSGSRLLEKDAEEALIRELLPMATVITPNLHEAEALIHNKVDSVKSMKEAAFAIAEKLGTAVLVKGGHLDEDALDVLYDGKAFYEFTSKRIDNPNTHGTGCTLSSAIACNLAEGADLVEAVKKAKDYVTGAIEAGYDIGNGRGPLNHLYRLF